MTRRNMSHMSQFHHIIFIHSDSILFKCASSSLLVCCKWQQHMAAGRLHLPFGRPLQTSQKSAPHVTKAERRDIYLSRSPAPGLPPSNRASALPPVLPACRSPSPTVLQSSQPRSCQPLRPRRMLQLRSPWLPVSTLLRDTGLMLFSMTLHKFEGKNVLPRLRFCPTNDRWAPIWWKLLLLPMPRKHLQPQRLHFRFLKFAMASYRFGPISLPVSTVLR